MNDVSYIAAAVALTVACAVAIKDRWSFANRSFIGLLALLAITEVFRGSGRHEIRVMFFAFAPGTALIFSLSFARSEYRKYLARWKYILALAFVLPTATLLLPLPAQ